MAKMSDEEVVAYLQSEADEASQYVWGELAVDRENALRHYLQLPYGNEVEGRTSVVDSTLQDSVEWIVANLIKMFAATDEVVVFEPTGPEDVEAAEQATAGCNYVFAKQNNGFVLLYTWLKDSMLYRNGAVTWRWRVEEIVESQTFRGLTEEELVMVSERGEIESSSSQDVTMPDGTVQRLYDARIRMTKKRGRVFVEAIPPNELLVSRRHNSILLDECKYVARCQRVTLSELREMGFEVEADELVDNRTAFLANPNRLLDDRDDLDFSRKFTDESLTEGWLYTEYVLLDVDGDGIAERRRIYRVGKRILENEPCSHVPIAAITPVILTHRFEGRSLDDLVDDLQRLKTEIIRQMVDNLRLANNQRKAVLASRDGAIHANLDDLLDSRPGGVVREYAQGAVRELTSQWVGGQSFPMLEYLDQARENRIGLSRYNQGLDPSSLQKTATGVQMLFSAAQLRLDLMARIIAECGMKPLMRGILKTLTENGMEPLMFRLRNEFVQYDPQEWRDGYDMSVTVGLGTGNRQEQAGHLMLIAQKQEALLMAGGMNIVTPKEYYATLAKIVENAGMKNVQDFFIDPTEALKQQQMNPQPPPPDPKVLIEQAKLQQQGKIKSAELQQDAQFEAMRMEQEERLAKYKADLEAQTKMALKQIEVAGMGAEQHVQEMHGVMGQIAQALQMLGQQIAETQARMEGSRTVAVERVTDENGRLIGGRVTRADGSVQEVPVQ